MLERLGLVRVKLMDAARFECGLEPRIDPVWKRRVGSFYFGQSPDGGDDFVRGIRPVERRAGVEDRQRGLQRDLLMF